MKFSALCADAMTHNSSRDASNISNKSCPTLSSESTSSSACAERPIRFSTNQPGLSTASTSPNYMFHLFRRPGTQALKIEPVVPQEIRHERCRRILEISEKKLHRFYSSQIGKTRPVLFGASGKKCPDAWVHRQLRESGTPFRKESHQYCMQCKNRAISSKKTIFPPYMRNSYKTT